MHHEFITLDTKLILRVRNELHWQIVPCSCRSGFAWTEPGGKMLGCITKIDPREYLEPTKVELKRKDAIKAVTALPPFGEEKCEALDGILHERFGQMAASINNSGVDGQLEHLFGECPTVTEVARMQGYLEEVFRDE